ncbi:hypothetical protein AVEN_201986-1, partial [Araneus ventricosus]
SSRGRIGGCGTRIRRPSESSDDVDRVVQNSADFHNSGARGTGNYHWSTDFNVQKRRCRFPNDFDLSSSKMTVKTVD